MLELMSSFAQRAVGFGVFDGGVSNVSLARAFVLSQSIWGPSCQLRMHISYTRMHISYTATQLCLFLLPPAIYQPCAYHSHAISSSTVTGH